jgi:hypothetical protein
MEASCAAVREWMLNGIRLTESGLIQKVVIPGKMSSFGLQPFQILLRQLHIL